jgi:hypothetical protein
MRAEEIWDEREHVIHLRIAAFVRRLTRRHRVGAHPKAFDPAVDELIGFVKRHIAVDEIAETLSSFRCEAYEAIRKARVEQSRTATGGLNVKRPRVVHQCDHRRHSGVADRLQYGAVVRESLIAPNAGLELEPRPRKRKPKDGAAQATRELDIFAIAIPKVGGFAAWNEPAHVLPNVANVVASVVSLALMVGSCDSELKAGRHVRQMRGGEAASLLQPSGELWCQCSAKYRQRFSGVVHWQQ